MTNIRTPTPMQISAANECPSCDAYGICPTHSWIHQWAHSVKDGGSVTRHLIINVVGCEDCGRPYGDEHGFPDLIVPAWIWEQLMPCRDGGGLLCPSCMCARAYKLDIHCLALFKSGPFYQKDQIIVAHDGGIWTANQVRDRLRGDAPT